MEDLYQKNGTSDHSPLATRHSPLTIRHFFFASSCIIETCNYICSRLEKRWPVRLGVRTADFHSVNRGSIPLRATRTRHPIEGGVFVLIRLDSKEKMVTMKFM